MSIEDGQPEEFTASWAQTWHNFVKPFLPSNILIFLVLWVLGYALGGPVVSVVLPIVVSGGIVGLQRVASRSSAVRISGYGIEVRRRNGELIGVRWGDVERVVILDKRRAGVIAPYGMPRAAAQASAAQFASANTGPGLVGQGTRLSPVSAAQVAGSPAWLEQPAQREAVQLFLMVVDRRWPQGRIGEWVRRYRPDLLAPAPSR